MSNHRKALASFAVYLLAAIFVSWPGISQLNTALIGRMGGDNYEHMWYLWWLSHSLFEGIGTPANIPLLNHPAGVYSPLNMTHLPVLFGPAVLGQLTTPIVAYNLAMIIAPALNALGMYWLALELTDNQHGALLAGLLFGFSPQILGHMQAGHLSLITLVGFPIFALFLLRLLHRPTLVRFAATALSAFLASSHPSHLAYFVLPTTLVIVAAAHKRLRSWKMWAWLTATGLLTATLLSPFYLPMLTSRTAISTRTLELGDSVGKSIDMASFAVPPPNNPLLLTDLRPFALRLVSSTDETHGYLGWVALGLALIGIAKHRRAVIHWAALVGGSILLSLGPFLKFTGSIVTLKMDGIAYPMQLPYALLAQLPLLSWSRTPARFGATMHFALAILAAYGLAALLTKMYKGRRTSLVALVLCLAALSERIIVWPFPNSPAWQTNTLRTLASGNPQRAVLNLPPSFTGNNLSLYGHTVHKRPIIGGRIFRGNRQDEINHNFLNALLHSRPEADIIVHPDTATRAAILAEYNIDDIVNQHWSENYDPEQRDFLITEFGPPLTTSELDSLFHLQPPPMKPLETIAPLTFTLHPTDWQAPELWGKSYARYFTNTARLYIYSAYTQSGHLRFASIPSLQPHRIKISINDNPLTVVIVGDNTTYVTPRLTITKGLNVVTFTDIDGAEKVWGDLRCAGTTTLAEIFPGQMQCNPHIKGARYLSAGIKNISWLDDHHHMPPIAQFGESIELTEALLPQISSTSELVLPLTFHSLSKVSDDLTLFVHVFGPIRNDAVKTPALVSQWDGWPLRGNFPTSQWDSGEHLGFRIVVPLSPNNPPGEYRVEIGWYYSATGTRLPVKASMHTTHDNAIWLGNFILRKD